MPELMPGEYDVTLNELNIHYTVRGTGPALIAHSGGPGLDARSWADFAHLDDFVTIVTIHPRGSGLSDLSWRDAYSLADYAADVEALRQHLGLVKPIVMGWSHGGMVAQQFAFTYPNSLSKLILVDTAACLNNFLGDIETAVQAYKDQPWFADAYAALQREWAGDYKTDEELAELWFREMKFYFKQFDAKAERYHQRIKDLPVRLRPLITFNEKEAPTMDLRPHLSNIQVPTLVIVGQHDFITNVSMAKEMVKHIPNAHLEIFAESGHFAVVEEPEKFYDLVKQFLLP